jgi:hypothetical protein
VTGWRRSPGKRASLSVGVALAVAAASYALSACSKARVNEDGVVLGDTTGPPKPFKERMGAREHQAETAAALTEKYG